MNIPHIRRHNRMKKMQMSIRKCYEMATKGPVNMNNLILIKGMQGLCYSKKNMNADDPLGCPYRRISSFQVWGSRNFL